MDEIKLYRKNQLGIGTWRIWGEVVDSTHGVLRYAHSVVEDGSEVEHEDHVTCNASGRDIEAQLLLERDSRVNRQLDKGYKSTREEALLGSTNQLGLLNPMLAQPIDKVAPIDFATTIVHVQPKLDGHRCLITNQGGNIFAYSRRGKAIESIPHVLQEFHWLNEGKTIDGELYVHGEKLQTIASLIKRTQPRSAELRYHWYDYVNDKPFADRYTAIEFAAKVKKLKHTDVVETTRVGGMDEIYDLFRRYRGEGYEGAMVRTSTAGYQPSVRSSQLLKVKERHDCEVEVLGARPSREGWAILRVKTLDTGRAFDVSAPGTVAEKSLVMAEITRYVGKLLTVEYAHLTSDGVPFHAVATRWREDV